MEIHLFEKGVRLLIEYDFSVIKPAVVRMLTVNMGLKNGERVLFMADAPNLQDWYGGYDIISDMALRALMTRQAYDIAKKAFAENPMEFFIFPVTGAHGTEPPLKVAKRMLGYDVIIIITSYSLSHTNARSNACAKGARIASCANLDLDMLYPGGVVDTDYFAIQAKSKHIAKLLTPAKDAHVVTPQGTDIRFSFEGRQGLFDDGFYTEPGSWGNLPGGEAYIAPLEGTGEGKIVVPAGWAYNLKEDMAFFVEKGELQRIEGGGKLGDYYRDFILGPDSPRSRRNLAELGIGTNSEAKKADNVLEAEKIDGTIHMAFGDNAHMGGTVDSDFHDDFVLPEPDLYLDSKLVIKAGKLLV